MNPASVGRSGDLVQGRLSRCLVAVGATKGACRSALALAVAGKAVPDAAWEVRDELRVGEVTQVVAANEVAPFGILGRAQARPSALLAVIRVAHTEVHLCISEPLRRLALHLVAEHARDLELRGLGDHDLVDEVPHDAGGVGRVHILRRVVVIVLRAVHVEGQRVRVAGPHRGRRRSWRDGPRRWRRRRHPRRRRGVLARHDVAAPAIPEEDGLVVVDAGSA
mmetsp:Transcript_93729/g.242180  ORF Transcript_93729/g.242180 Transcript_93729/m.242180 type:complete len:222 (-) Transcript_93729:406-1071(-)